MMMITENHSPIERNLSNLPMTPVKSRPDNSQVSEAHPGTRSPRTPNRPILMQSQYMCSSSPLRSVGRTSPCSTKLTSGLVSHIEAGSITSYSPFNYGLLGFSPDYGSSPVQSPTRQLGGMYPRELSFANLLDNTMGPGDSDSAEVRHCISLPTSPRKRPRKHTPIRAVDSD